MGSAVSPQTARVLLSGTAKLKDAAEAINCCQIDRLILKPWRGEDLLAHLKDVARGLLLERSHERLLEEMRTLNLQLEKRVAERTQELRASNQILEKMALTDPLTALPNRRAIDLIARKELLRRARNGSPLAVGLIDATASSRSTRATSTRAGITHSSAWRASSSTRCGPPMPSAASAGKSS